MRKYLVGVLGLALISCKSSDTTAPTTIGESGSMSFSYTGAGGSGSYSATGAVPTNLSSNSTTFGTTPWAAATLQGGTTGIDVFASVPSGSTWNIGSVELAQQTTGTFQINTSTCTTSFCNEVLIAFGTNTTESTYTYICTLTTGSITLTSKTSTHMTGSFSGSGTCLSAAGASSAFAVTNGTFDVGIYTGQV